MQFFGVMCGIPGSGKSTFCDEYKRVHPYLKVVSRDEIRFSMVKENEEYFSKEDKVLEEFHRRIDEFLKEGYDVIADATHLSKKARAEMLELHKIDGIETKIFWKDIDLATALARNDTREGRAKVPRSVIRRMFYQMDKPSIEEGFDKIIMI